MKVLILYYSKTGHTLEAANATANGIRSAGSEVHLIAATEFASTRIASYDALIVASPCWAGSAGRAMLPKPLDRALAALAACDLREKRCGGISVHSGIGGEDTIKHIGEILMQKGNTDYRPGPVARAGVPFSLWKGPSVQPQDEALFTAYGKAFVAKPM
jgi:flavodoxin